MKWNVVQPGIASFKVPERGELLRALVAKTAVVGVVSLVVLMPWQPASAQTGKHSLADAGARQLAEQLAGLIENEDLAASCRLHLAEIETVSGPFLTDPSFEAMQTALGEELNARFPDSGCETAFSREPTGAAAQDIVDRVSDEAGPSFVFTMTFFPRRGPTQMLLATAYRPNGRFAAFSGPLDVETETAVAENAPAPTPTPAPATPAPATPTPVTPTGETPAAADEPDFAAPAQARPAEDQPAATTTAAIDQSDDAEVDASGLIGTPEEIEAINAEKLSVAPEPAAEPEAPETGLRIDVAGNSGSVMIMELASNFLLGQSEVTASQASVEQQAGGIRLTGGPEAPLQRIELLDSDPTTAFEKLFNGDVDLVLSSMPISQADYDRFAEAYGVDMRSGSGETVIGVEAGGLIVHPSNQLQSLTKEAAVAIFENEAESWDQDILAPSGLSGPIETLAAVKGAVLNGAAIEPDVILEADAKVADMVSANPLSIGYSSTVDQGDHRVLEIEECGITYDSDDFHMRTEDHPLARRLFLYANPAKGNKFRNAFLFFATSDQGQDLIAQHIVNLEAEIGDRDMAENRVEVIDEQKVTTRDTRRRLLGMLDGARRLSTTFRFRFDSDELRLDQSAAKDLANLIRLAERENIDPERLVVLGFADTDGTVDYNLALSNERAAAIAKRLVTYGVPIPDRNVAGFGEEAPIACNDDEEGKSRNRRVEVWLKN